MRVTRIAFWLNIHLHARADEASLCKGRSCTIFTCTTGIIAATFHWHGFKHARIARYNAETVFKLTDKEKDIIQSHMWPLTPTDIPTAARPRWSAWDKMSSSYETVLERKAKKEIKHFGPCSFWQAPPSPYWGVCLAEGARLLWR